MFDALISALGSVGVPAAILASLVIAVSFRKIHRRFSYAGATITLIGVLAFLAIDLFPRAVDSFIAPVEIRSQPSAFYGYTTTGTPIDVTVVAQRGGTEIVERRFPRVLREQLEERTLLIKRHPTRDAFLVLHGDTPKGALRDESIAAAGLMRRYVGGQENVDVLHTSKVCAGQTVSLGETSHGELSLSFIKIDRGAAIIALSSHQFGLPEPATVAIKNKALDSQIFGGLHEFVVAVREADFTVDRPWAAFTIVATN